MFTTGKFVYFNYTQYAERDGFSYGFAKSSDLERQIFLGTNFRVFPEISGDEVVMGRERNYDPIDTGTPLEGRDVRIETRELKKGIGGYWCFMEEWAMMEDRLKIEQERRRTIEEESRRQVEEYHKRVAENPKTIEEALAHGWAEKTRNGRQVFLKNGAGRVITRYTAKPPARPKRCMTSRFATV